MGESTDFLLTSVILVVAITSLFPSEISIGQMPESTHSAHDSRPAGFWWAAVSLFVPLAALILMVAAVTYYYERNLQYQKSLVVESRSLDAATQVIHTRLSDIASDLRVFAASPALARFLSNASDDDRAAVKKYFRALVDSKGFYDQVRVLNELGMELVCVNYTDGHAEIVPEAMLEDKSTRYYVSETLQLQRGEVFISKFDLNIERGQIERPFKPVLRLSTPAFDQQGNQRGLVILNYLGADLHRLIDESMASLNSSLILLNADGYWLFAQRPEDEWGFMLGNERRFQQDFPTIWERLRELSGQLWEAGALFSYRKLNPVKDITAVDQALSATVYDQKSAPPEYEWVLMSVVSAADFSALLLPIKQRIGMISGVLLLVAGAASWWFGVIRTTTLKLSWQREQALREAREKQSLLELFIQHVPAAVAMLDIDMRYVAVSQRWCQDYRLTENLIGRSHYEIFPETPERWREIHQRCLAGAVERHDEDPFPRHDGRVDWLRWEVRPWYGAEGRVGGLIMLTEVITERRKAEQIKDEFVSKVSHELRTPMTAIYGALKLLDSGVVGAIDEQKQPLFNILASNTDRLLNLVNDLLDVQRVKLGALEFTFEVTDMAELARDTLTSMTELATTRGVRLEFEDLSGTSRVLLCDRIRLGQVLTNLLSNALKHSPEGGVVRVQLLMSAGHLRVEVIDEGPGVPESFSEQIFAEFAQADHGDTRIPGSSGLGLAISRAIVERHRGCIGYVNRCESGAVFYFEIPSSDLDRLSA